MRITLTPRYAIFRRHLLHAAQVNISEYCAWRNAFEPVLHRQYQQSNSTDPLAFHQTRFERDVGLVLANGTVTRIGAEETL